ncbi:MAG: DUF3501 family protein [Ferrimicrobium sp.]
MTRLTRDDIVDLQQYERVRPEFRRSVIELKRIRRLAVGDIMTLVFENRQTMLFQIQEMARAERMLRDDQIVEELEAYNPLIPNEGELSATVFIELITKADLEYWLPRLVGVESALSVLVGEHRCAGIVDPAHLEQLSRTDVTASVHYVRFSVPLELRRDFVLGPVTVEVDHENYRASTLMPQAMRESLASDWTSGLH